MLISVQLLQVLGFCLILFLETLFDQLSVRKLKKGVLAEDCEKCELKHMEIHMAENVSPEQCNNQPPMVRFYFLFISTFDVYFFQILTIQFGSFTYCSKSYRLQPTLKLGLGFSIYWSTVLIIILGAEILVFLDCRVLLS